MGDLILQLIFMVSLGASVYIVAQALPKIGEDELGVTPANRFQEFLKNLPLERIDAAFMSFRDKILRRAKVLIMKADNFVSHRLNNKEDKL